MRCEKVVKFSPGKVPKFHAFFAVFLKLTHLLNDFESKPNEILTHFAPTDILAEITKCWHLPWGEFHPFSTFGPIWTLGSLGASGDQSVSLGRLWGARTAQDGAKMVKDGAKPTVRPTVRPSVRPTDRPTLRPSGRQSIRPTDYIH